MCKRDTIPSCKIYQSFCKKSPSIFIIQRNQNRSLKFSKIFKFTLRSVLYMEKLQLLLQSIGKRHLIKVF